MQTLEAGQSEAPRVLRRHRVDAHAEVSVRAGLEILHYRRVGAHDIGQVLGVSHARQASFLFGRRQSRHVVLRALVDALDVLFGGGRQRRLFVELLPVRLRSAGIAEISVLLRLGVGQQNVGAKSFFVEKYPGAHAERRIEFSVPYARVSGYVNAEIADHALGYRTVRAGALDGVGASVA